MSKYELTELSGIIADVDARLASLEAADPESPEYDQRIAVLETRATTTESALTAHDQRIVDHAAALADIGPRLTEVERFSADATSYFVQVENRIAALEARPAGGSSFWPGHVLLSSFLPSGSTDYTAAMRAALASIKNDPAGRKRVLVMDPNVTLAPGATPFEGFSGMSIVSGTVSTTEFSYSSRVTISGAAPNGVFAFPSGQTKGVTIANIGWEGPGTSQVCRFFADNTSDQFAYSQIHGCSFDNFTSVFRRKVLGVVWSGTGYCNNSTETPFEISGSDWAFFTGGKTFLDSPNLKDTDYLLHVKSANKGLIGSIFITGNGPTPMRISGGQMLRVENVELESMKATPGYRKTAGSGLFVSGGITTIDNAWFLGTMNDPAKTLRGDNGVVHVQGAGTSLHMRSATFGEYFSDPSVEHPVGYTENHVYAKDSAQVVLDAPRVTNMQENSGTGGVRTARALKTEKAGTATILASMYTSL